MGGQMGTGSSFGDSATILVVPLRPLLTDILLIAQPQPWSAKAAPYHAGVAVRGFKPLRALVTFASIWKSASRRQWLKKRELQNGS